MKFNYLANTTVFAALCLGMPALVSCRNNQPEQRAQTTTTAKKIGILMVNHGSRSETWRKALLALETSVKDSILKSGEVSGTKTAFMEYTEPSIATRLKEFDKEGYTDVVIVPVFLTVSTHSFDDIPTIVGQKEDPKSMQTLKVEHIERYTPKATVHIAPLLDFTEALQKNILTRVAALSKDAAHEALTLIAYGDQTYNAEWTALLNKVGAYVQAQTGIPHYSYGWCGHVAHYSADSTTAAINRALRPGNKAIVIPVLVAKDEMFQVKIIGDGIAKIPDAMNKVVYMADAILPDKNIERWVINAAAAYAGKVKNSIAKQ